MHMFIHILKSCDSAYHMNKKATDGFNQMVDKDVS